MKVKIAVHKCCRHLTPWAASDCNTDALANCRIQLGRVINRDFGMGGTRPPPLAKYVLIVNDYIDYYQKAREARQKFYIWGGPMG